MACLELIEYDLLKCILFKFEFQIRIHKKQYLSQLIEISSPIRYPYDHHTMMASVKNDF